MAAYVDFGKEVNFDQYQVNTVATMKLAKLAESNGVYFIFCFNGRCTRKCGFVY